MLSFAAVLEPLRFNVNHPRLLSAISQMESHLEDPLACSAIADMVGQSMVPSPADRAST